MNPLAATGRWLSSLGGRITLFVIKALVIAQVLGIFVFARSNEQEQTELRVEGLLRQISASVNILN